MAQKCRASRSQSACGSSAGRLRVVLQPIMATKKGTRTGGLRAFSLQPPAELNHSLGRLTRPVRTLACPSYQLFKPTDPSMPRMDKVRSTIPINHWQLLGTHK
jgi:hypothetical protein